MKNKNRILFKIILFTVFIITVLWDVAAGDPPEILEIRSLYYETGNDIAEDYIKPVTLGFGRGNIARLYSYPHENVLVKVIKDESTDNFDVYTEYLYDFGELVFVFERTILKGSGKMLELRFYLKDEKLIRFILDSDSERTIFDRDLGQWEAKLEPFAADARNLAYSYDFSLGQILQHMMSIGQMEQMEEIGPAESSIEVSFSPDSDEHTGSGQPVPVIVTLKTYQLVWEIEADRVSGAGASFQMEDNGLALDISYKGSDGTKYVLQYNNEGVLQLIAEYYGSKEKNSPIFIFPVPLKESLSIKVVNPEEEGIYGPGFGENSNHHSDSRRKNAFILPEIIKSPTAPVFWADDISKNKDTENVYRYYLSEENYGYPRLDETSGILTLTPDDRYSASGVAFLNEDQTLPMEIKFEFNIWDDDGGPHELYNSADGICLMIGKNEDAYEENIPPAGGSMGFINDGTGIGVFFKTYGDRGVRISDGWGSLLAGCYEPRVYTGGEWQEAEVRITDQSIEVYMGEELILQWRGAVTLPHKGIAFGGATGGSDSCHQIRRVAIE